MPGSSVRYLFYTSIFAHVTSPNTGGDREDENTGHEYHPPAGQSHKTLPACAEVQELETVEEHGRISELWG